MATDGQWQQLSRELERAMMLTQRELELKNERLQILDNLKRLKEEKLRLLSDNQWAESDYSDCAAWTPTPQAPEQVAAGLREAFKASQETSNDRQIGSLSPAVGLVERLGSVPDVWSAGKPLHPAARRAAIHHIADWLELQQEVPIGSTASADYFAAMLREEAGR